MGSYYRQQLEDYLKTLDVKAELVFDVGGIQKPVRGRTKTWDVKKCHILDIPEYDLNIPQNKVENGDWVFCLEVFEYLLVPTVAIKNIADLLKPGGKAVISFAFIYPFHNETDWDTLRYTETGVKRLAQHASLKVDKIIKRRTKTGSLQKYYAEDGMRPAKGHDHNVTGFIAEMYK